MSVSMSETPTPPTTTTTTPTARFRIGTTLTNFVLANQRACNPQATGELSGLLFDITLACKKIADLVQRGPLIGIQGAVDDINVQGEQQKQLDVLANELVKEALASNRHCAALCSEEDDDVVVFPRAVESGATYVVAADPLDGSSNVDVNLSIGTIFSVLRRVDMSKPPSVADFMQPCSQQVAAGYAIYGPCVQLVLTLGGGSGTHIFSLDRDVGEFILTETNVKVTQGAKEFAINMSNRRHWSTPIRQWVEDMEAGKEGPLKVDFNMRWLGSMVAEVHRLLRRSGVWLYPCDVKLAASGKTGRIRLLYEAAPMALIMREAGGSSSVLPGNVLDVNPTELHQRVPIMLGAADRVSELDARITAAGGSN